MNDGSLPGVYVHVPFCRSKCPYCDFYSVTSLEMATAWLDAVGTEARHYRDLFARVDSVYIGGGTPSLLEDAVLAGLLDRLRGAFVLEPGSEITIEINPGDACSDKLRFMKDLGVNRVSIGVQSFNERELRFLRRRHTAAQAEKTFEEARASGFDNVGVDLIYGFAGHDAKAWLRSLGRVSALGPEHVSCYQMTLEAGTPFGKMHAEGTLDSLDEERQADLFLMASEFLGNSGYLHYEVSNYSKGKERRSRHNMKYWRHIPYLGLGPSAHSFHGNRRWWNVRSVEEYCRRIAEGGMPVEAGESLEKEQLDLERLFLGFRTIDGVALASMAGYETAGPVLDRLRESGLISIVDERVVPTARGFLVADGLPLLFDHS